MKTDSDKIVSITELAGEEISRLIKEDGRPGIALRLGVKGGGCSGLSYVLDLDSPKENDQVYSEAGFQVCMDLKSSLYLKDVLLDYNSGLKDRGFKFKNPGASNTCGCGESFSI
jgi:iron-sulfur cluster assembly protein